MIFREEKFEMKRLFFTEKDNNKSFTLIELMIAATIFLIAFVGILISYFTCLELSEISKNTSIAVHASKARLETIRNTTFNQIKATYNNTAFVIANFNGKGVSYVDDTNPRLLKITVSFCWKQPSGRVVGEDKNLNGQLDAGEDTNGNGTIDSPVQLVSYIFQ